MGLALSGCQSNPARDLAYAAGVRGGEPKTPPDFIAKSRRDGLDYIPVGTSAPERAYRVKTKTEVSGAESELERTRGRNQAKSAQE